MAESTKAPGGRANATASAATKTGAAAAAGAGSAALSRRQAPIQFNPISRWEEPIEVPGLTLWDVHCQPRRIEDDNSSKRIRVSVKQLSSEFHCPVCLGYFKNVVTVMECLHRFCSECIEKCLRIGKKECPSCRIHIPSRRSLRNDNNFEDIMRSIYGDIEKLEKHEAKEIEILNKTQNMNNAAQKSRKMGIRQQNKSRGKKRAASPTGDVASGGRGGERAASAAAASASPSAAAASASSPPSAKRKRKESSPAPKQTAPKVTGLEQSTMISFVLRRHPQETKLDRLDKEVLKTSRDMSIETIKRFLSAKLSHAPSSDFQIVCAVGGKPAIIEDSTTLGEVQGEIVDESKAAIMVLHYRLTPMA